MSPLAEDLFRLGLEMSKAQRDAAELERIALAELQALRKQQAADIAAENITEAHAWPVKPNKHDD